MIGTLPSNAGLGGGCGFIPWVGSWDPTCLVIKTPEQKQYCNKFNEDFKDDPHQRKNLLKKFILFQNFKKKFCLSRVTKIFILHFLLYALYYYLSDKDHK